MTISAIVLAAGRSSRFEGGDKLLALVEGKPILRSALEALDASAVSDIIVVTKPGATQLKHCAGDGRWRYVENTDAAQGIASSLRAGLREVDPQSSGAMIALGDMPFISATLIDQLCAAFELCRGAAIVFPSAPDGRQGHPVVWPRRFFEALLALDGDQGGKSVLAANREFWHSVIVDDGAIFIDIDTEDDLRAAKDRG